MGEAMRTVTIRMSARRWAEVETVARREGRSGGGQVRYVLDRWLDGPAGHDLRAMADQRVERLMSG